MPAGRDIPAAGAGGAARRLHPAAPGGSCRTGTAQMGASPRTRTPSAPPGLGERRPRRGRCARSWRLHPQGQGQGTAGVSQGREEQPQERGRLAERAGSSPGRGAGHRGPLAGVSSAAGRCLEAAGAAGTATLRFGRFAAPGNRSGSPTTSPVPVEAYQGCKHRKGNLKSSIHTPSTGTKEGGNASQGFRYLPRKGRPTVASSYVPRSILSWVGTHCCYPSLPT